MNSTPETTEIPLEQPAPPKRSWRRFPRGRKAIAAGAAVAGLAIGGIGFGAGYAVADQGDTTQQTTGFDQGDRGFPDGGMGGGPGGQMGGAPDGTTDGTTGQAPDFDGDGQPDETAPDTSTDSGDDSTTQQG